MGKDRLDQRPRKTKVDQAASKTIVAKLLSSQYQRPATTIFFSWAGSNLPVSLAKCIIH
jgi:hypothetical protein